MLLIHHPPLPGQAARARHLTDATELEAILTSHGIDLVVHGHNHRNMEAWRQGPRGPFAVIGAPSASLGRRHGREPLARYNLYRFTNDAKGRSIELVGRGLVDPNGPIVELERRFLVAPSQA